MSELRQLFQDMLKQIPVSLAVREMTRLAALRKYLPQQGEILDVGCGDGSFWKVYPGVKQLQLDGIDLSCNEILLARATGVYRYLEVSDISLKIPDRKYDLILGNCSLEHVPNIHKALNNIHAALNDQGKLLMFVPSFGWCRSLQFVRMLALISPRLEMAASGAIDGFFQHHHIYDDTAWVTLIEKAGYRVSSIQGLGAPVINKTFEAWLPMAFLEFLYKCLTKHYPSWQILRRMPSAAFFESMAVQPVPLGSSGIAEYIVEAHPV